jgi:hypothetical protein
MFSDGGLALRQYKKTRSSLILSRPPSAISLPQNPNLYESEIDFADINFNSSELVNISEFDDFYWDSYYSSDSSSEIHTECRWLAAHHS